MIVRKQKTNLCTNTIIKALSASAKELEGDCRVKQLFNTDLLHVQRYLFNRLRIEPTSEVEVEYDDKSKLLGMVKVYDDNDVHTPPFSSLYFDLHTYSGILASEDTIRL